MPAKIYENQSRVPQLDILRALAVFLVFGRHLPNMPAGVEGLGYSIAAQLRLSGWIGVDLFFVISGFLVSSLLFREHEKHGSIHLKRFFIRRGFKIYPAFYAFFLITYLAIPFLIGDIRPKPSQVFSEIFYLQNYIPGLWGHTWSLAVEEHFYIILGLVFFVCMKSKTADIFGPLVKTLFLCAAGCLVLRLVSVSLYPLQKTPYILYPTHFRADSLFFGVALSYLHHYYQPFRGLVCKNKKMILALSLLFIVPAWVTNINDSFFMRTFGLSLLYLGFGGVLVLALYCVDGAKLAKNKTAMVFAFIGYYSYSIYLWHEAVRVWGVFLLKKFSPVPVHYSIQVLFFIVVSLGLGIAMARIIEMPLLKVRDFYFSSRSGRPV